MEIYQISFILFQTFMIPVIFFSLIFYFVSIGSLFIKNPKFRFKLKKFKWPFVTIQIPVYNDPVAARCIETCMKLDYPKNRYEVIVADDSTDEKTREILDKYAKKYPIKLIRRGNRKGFKAGALNNALKYSKGEIVTVFDADFVPPKNFLKEVVKPFLVDERIAIVQTRMGFLNYDQNIITRFAASLLAAYHHCWLPLFNKVNSVFFCGTHGAIRRSVLEEVGGWNEENLTEDADLSVKILDKGYKNIYLSDMKVPGEVPFTLSGFIKQQSRWVYGQTQTFMGNWKRILFSKTLKLSQKLSIFFVTLGGITAPFVIGMTFFGQVALFTAPPKPVGFIDMLNFVKNFIITMGFLFMLWVAVF
ncbi:MAG: glycosyltransferase, partial [Candidatus Aenigmarchaeota archaeon]|nr:glycosyltransferase [Candidatus Aenigmarchaeota archaeon]